MPDLVHSLQDHDLGHLHIVAGLWGIELKSKDLDGAMHELAAAILDNQLARELVASLNPEAVAALTALGRAGGRIPWTTFSRLYGDIREMGAGKRDREKPYLKPASAAEVLFYRGFLARAFFDTDTGPQEFAYLPDDWLPIIREGPRGQLPAAIMPLGRPAAPAERAHLLLASDRILDDATTLLAALRIGRSTDPDPLLQGLLNESGVLKKNALRAEKAKSFLEASRTDALQMLRDAWRTSEKINELRLMPNLICDGEWTNPTLQVRSFLLSLLQAIPAGTWWSLGAFTSEIKRNYPDFQRTAGEYDSWFIKSAVDGRYLRGFGDWDQVEGALIRFLIADVLFRLGMLDLAASGEGADPSAFRMRAQAEHGSPFPDIENAKLHVASNGIITAPRRVPRAVRYQLARFCEWDEERPDEFRYRVTPRSLTLAAEQGLKVEHLLALLAHHADARLPAAMVKALKRWEASGTEARAEVQVILRVSRPGILEELRKSKAARFLGEPLGPTTIVIKRGAQAKVMAVLAELGLLGQDNTAPTADSDTPERPASTSGRQTPKS